MVDTNTAYRTGTSWLDEGILLIENAITGADLHQLKDWVTELEHMPGSATGLLHYDEQTSGGTRRCRTENFLPFHDRLRTLINTGLPGSIAEELLGEPARLYKEKVNYKAPGGAGFAAHQDAPAYPYVRNTIACMIAVDDATPANGCLEIVRGCHRRQLPTDDSGCIAPALAAKLTWEPLPVTAGSLLFFHCYVPHRSAANTTARTRRAIYLTYHAASDGDLRTAYYSAKTSQLAATPERLSLIGHFTGSAHPATATDTDTDTDTDTEGS